MRELNPAPSGRPPLHFEFAPAVSAFAFVTDIIGDKQR